MPLNKLVRIIVQSMLFLLRSMLHSLSAGSVSGDLVLCISFRLSLPLMEFLILPLASLKKYQQTSLLICVMFLCATVCVIFLCATVCVMFLCATVFLCATAFLCATVFGFLAFLMGTPVGLSSLNYILGESCVYTLEDIFMVAKIWGFFEKIPKF